MDSYIEQYPLNTAPLYGFCYLQLLTNKRGDIEDYIFLEINSGFEEIFGFSRVDFLGKKSSDIEGCHKLLRFDLLSHYRQAVISGKTQEFEQQIQPYGRNFLVTVMPSGRDYLALAIRDTSEPLSVKAAFPNEDAELNGLDTLFNSTHDAILLIKHTEEGFRYIRNNALHQKLTGFFEVYNKSPIELLGSEIGEKLINYYKQCIQTKASVTYEQEYFFVQSKRIWQTEITPLFGVSGIRYLLSCSKDVTEFKAIQNENEVLLQRLHSMFNLHDAIMMIIDPITGRILDANPAASRFYGYAREELLGLYIHDINMLPPEEVERRRLMACEYNQQNFLFPHRLKSGEIRMVDVNSCPITDGDSKVLYSIIVDVTDREMYRKDLIREKEMFRTTLQSIGDGVVTTNNNGLITSLNRVAQDLTEWKIEEAEGRPFADVFQLINEETGKPVENPIQKVLDSGRIIGLANHTVLLTRNGRKLPIADSAAPIKTGDGKIFGVVMVFRDVSKEKEHNNQIKHMSYHDSLTGLYNRRYIEEAISQWDTPENQPISIIMGDVNGLKITNDVFGHAAGDNLLRQVARTVKENCFDENLVARWGGDEFVVVMLKTDISIAEDVIRKIRYSCDNAGDNRLRMSLSLGCAVKKAHKEKIQNVFRLAEEYMYHQKLLDGKSYRNTIINTLLATLYEKSTETEEHAKRLKSSCHAMGRILELSSKDMDDLSLLAILHDIGKVAINQNILQKPSSLTPEEWEEMKRHPEIGYRIAQTTPELAVVADLILSHHERWDGKGYPRGMKGEEIPLVCRILAVADSFDAMINDRIYRKAMSHGEAITELRKNAGAQFDPSLVELFIDIVHSVPGYDCIPLSDDYLSM